MRRLLLTLTVAIATSLSDGSAAIPAAPVQPPGLPAAKVTQVVDGDTIKVRLQGREYTLRLIGMDTPETVDPRKSVQCYGPEASNFAKRLLNNLDDFCGGETGRLNRGGWGGCAAVGQAGCDGNGKREQ